jgi:hypothetical protein
MKQQVIIIAAVFAFTAAVAAAEALPVPRQPGGCPIGYSWQGEYCIPLNSSTAPAIPKAANGSCPAGWTVQRSYCVRL